MSGRFFLPSEEIFRKYGKPIMTLHWHWAHSDIYYDAEEDRFIEERYHEEYLDTGTVCDGCFPISDSSLWDELVKTCNEAGMSAYLRIRKKPPMPERQGESISLDAFYEGIHALGHSDPRRQCYCRQIGSVIIIVNESNVLLGIVGKTELYCFFYNPRSGVKGEGFYTFGEALAAALKCVTFYHNNHIVRDEVCRQPPSAEVKPSPPTATTPPTSTEILHNKRRHQFWVAPLLIGLLFAILGIVYFETSMICFGALFVLVSLIGIISEQLKRREKRGYKKHSTKRL